MKRLISFFTAICIFFSICPISMAAIRTDYVSSDSFPSGLKASTVDGEDEPVFVYSDRCSYVKIKLNEPIEGKVKAGFKVKVKDGSYADFRIQMVNEEVKDLKTLQFTPQGNGTTKISPAAQGSNGGIVDYDAFPCDEWVKVNLIVDMNNKNFTSTLEYEDGTVRELHTESAFNDRDIINFSQLTFAFNRATNENYAGPAYFKDFEVYGEISIKSVKEINDDIEVGGKYIFPNTVTAVLEDNSEQEVPVVWEEDTVDTSAEGIQEIYGTVAGYDGKVKLILKVKTVKILSLEEINEEIEVGDEYVLPLKVTANLDNGTQKEVSVKWEKEAVDTSIAGKQEISGTVDGYDGYAKLNLTIKPLTIESCDNIKVYLMRNEESLPSRIKVNYTNGTYGYADVVWNEIDTAATEMQEVIGNINGFSNEVKAEVYLYKPNSPLFTETVEDCVKGEMLGGRYLSPLPREDSDDYWGWQMNVPSTTRVRPNPTNSDAMSICIPVNSSYSDIGVGSPKTGKTIVSFDLYFPNEETDLRTMLCSQSKEALVELTYNAKTGTIVRSGSGSITWTGIFEAEHWTNIKYIADEDTETYDLLVNNVVIGENIPFKSLGRENMMYLRFGNKSKNECDIYLDNIKMYALNDMLGSAYDEVALDGGMVTDNIILKNPADSSIEAVWESSDQQIIANDGTVTRPEWKSGDKTVTMKVTLTKNIGADIDVSQSYSFNVSVKEADPTDELSAELAAEALTFESISNGNASEDDIQNDLILSESGEYGVAIKWASDNTEVIDNTGKIFTPKSDTVVTVKAILTKGSVSLSKEFKLTVKANSELSDLQAVRKAMQKLEIPDATSSNITLPKSGDNGVDISWNSSNTSVLSNTGAYKKPSKTVDVILTAVLTKGNAREEKSFTVTVKAKSSSGGGGGGGGSSSSNKVSIVANTGLISASPSEAPIITPKPEITSNDGFADLYGYEWAAEAINSLSNENILSGTGENKFEPGRNVVREEFVAMVVRVFGFENRDSVIPFDDISKSDWYYDVCTAAFSNGIINGISNDNFGAGLEIKRQDMFVIAYNAVVKSGIKLENVRDMAEFDDFDEVSEYAREAFAALYKAGIVNGTDENTISPNKSATRAEAAKLIYEIHKL